MKKISTCLFFIVLFFFSSAPNANATHIVGGSLTYIYNGGSSYTVTLTLYRDCGGGAAAYPASVTIQVQQANGSEFAPSRDILNIPGGVISNVPYSLDTCAIPPSPIPCVQVRTYTATVDLPPVSGGYHMYYSLCCRNVSLSNINTTAQNNPGDGESFYAFIPGTSIWYEDFTLANGTTNDAGPTAWTRTLGATPPVYASVQANLFEVQGANNASAVWTSQLINISSAPGGANISVDLAEAGNMDGTDTIFVYYSLDGGLPTLFTTNGFIANDFTNAIATVNGLIGTNVQIFVRAQYDAVSPNTEFYRWDNVLVYNSVSNTNPVYNSFPPLFLCAGNFFSFDHSASDADGDSLFYSFYRPYTDLAPTFPLNVATFTPVTWLPGYTDSSPLNAGGPALTLNPSTGLLSGTPNTIGQYQVGIKTTEYRSGVMVSEMVRDFQFNIINCPPPAQALITPSGTLTVCSGNTLTFPNNSDASATNWTWNFGDLTTTLDVSTLQFPTYSYPGPGSYIATLITNAGTSCADTSTATVNVTVPPAAPTAGSNSPVCIGSPINLTASAIAGATYTWTGPNAFTSSLQNPSIGSAAAVNAGTYSVTATVSGCTGAAGTTTVVVNPLPAAPTAGSNSPVCVGATINLTASAIAGATYSWTGPNAFTSSSQNPSIGSAAAVNAGTYSVTATVGGCTGPAGTTTVVVSPSPVAPTAGSNSPVCVGSPINLTASAIAGATYSWTGPNAFTSTLQNPTIASAMVVMAGTYSVTATVAGCTGPAGTVTVVVNPIPVAPTAGSNSPVCVGSPINLTASLIAGATYSWTGPSAFTSALQNPSIGSAAAVNAGTYSVTATVGGCTGPAGTTVVVVNPIPATPSAGSNSPVCVGATINLTTPAVAGATYNWTGPAAFSSALQNPTRPGATLAMAGTYSVTVTVAGCTSAFGTTTVVVNPIPATPTCGSNSPVCAGATINLTTPLVAGATYNWTGPAAFSSTLQNPTRPSATLAMAGTYSVTITVAGCTSAVGTTTVVVNPTPAAPTAGNNGPLCVGQTLNLTASAIAGATYSWTGPGGFTSSVQNPSIPGVTLAESGVYSVTATVGGCTGPAGTTNVIVNTVPGTPTVGSNSPVCTNSTLNLTTPFIAGATYTWTGPNSFSSSLQNPSIGSVTLLAAGTYTLTVSVGTCSSAAGTTVVVINPTPTITAANNGPLCVGATLNLTASNVAGATYSWTGPSAFSSSLQNPSIGGVTLANAGTYSVTATLNGCTSAIQTTTVVINPIPATPTAGSNSPVCTGTTINLTTPLVAGATYSWTGPSAFTSSLQNPTIAGATAVNAGTYSVTVAVNGCVSAAGTTTVVINPTPAAPTASSNSPICEFTQLDLTASLVAGATYSWTGPGGFTSSVQNPSIPGITIAGAGTYSVTVTVTGCTSVAGTTNVVINPAPSVPVAGNSSPVCDGQNINLTASAIAGATYSWTGPVGYTSSLQNPVIAGATSANAGTYYVTATVAGCTGLADSTVVIVNANPIAPTLSSNSPVCTGDSILLFASTVAGATYSWTGPGGFTSMLQNPFIANALLANAGTYDVLVSAAGCPSTSTSSIVITVNATPSTPITGNNGPLCEGSTLNLTASNIPGATYSWTGPLGFTASTQNTSVSSVTTANAGVYSVTASANGCTSIAGTTVVIDAPALANAGGDQTVCANNAVVSISGSVSGGSITGIWTSSGSGIFSPSATSLTATYTPSAADTAAGTITLTLTSTNNGACPPSVSSLNVTITDAPTVNAGTDVSVCANNANVVLNGQITTATGGIWTSSGTGTFSPSNATLNAIYMPSSADTISGLVTLTLTSTGNGACLAVSDSMTITITDALSVNAGADQFVCLSSPNASLSGIVIGGSGTGIWTTSGTGSFSPSDISLNTTYIPSTADTAAGSVLIILTSTNNGGCNPSMDSLVITYTTVPVVTAGPDQTVCANNAAVTLAGSINGTTTTGIWSSSGDGTFSPTNTDLNAVYIPGVSDTTAGSVTLTLSSTFACAVIADAMVITITPAPVVDAGPDVFVCANAPDASITASVSVATTTGIWSTTGTGTISPSNTSMSIVYSPSATDISTGSVVLVMTSTGNGSCNAVSDTMVVIITPPPAAFAGNDTSMCANSTLQLAGIITGGIGTGAWTSSGTGVFSPSGNDLNAVYTPSSADTLSGSVTLTLTSTNNGGCIAASDDILVTITDAPVANAGTDQTVCANNANVSLNGTISIASGGTWTTNGTGTFDNASALNANYTPSAADIISGSVVLTLSSTGNATCNPSVDSMMITITPAPFVNAGSDIFICTGTTIAGLNGNVSGGSTTGLWTTLGSGFFTPVDTDLNATYNLSTADTTAGVVMLVLTSTSNGTCLAVSDSVTITITTIPLSVAGPDQVLCSNNGATTLNGIITGGSGMGQWTTYNGSGTFSPTDTTLNAVYIPTAADTAQGFVSLVLTPINACLNTPDTMMVTFTDAPWVFAGNDQSVCNGGNIDLSALINTIPAGIVWTTNGSGTFTPNDSSLTVSYIPAISDTSLSILYFYTATSGNGTCNPALDTIQVLLGNTPLAAFSSNGNCAGSTINFTDASTVSAGTVNAWEWDMGNGDTSTVQNPSTTYLTAGSYTVTLVAYSGGGCSDTTTQVIIINTVPVAAFSYLSNCSSDSVLFTDNSNIPTGTITQWSWNFGDTTSSTLQHPVHVYGLVDTFTVVLTVTSDSGCTATITQDVIVAPRPLANFDYSISCVDGMVTYSDSSVAFASDPILTYAWTFGNGNTSTLQNPPPQTYLPGTYTVQLQVTTQGGCVQTDTMSITIYGLPLAGYIPAGGTYSANEVINFTDQSQNGTSFYWDFGYNNDSSLIQNPVYSFVVAGSYTVVEYVTNPGGCTDTAAYLFVIDEELDEPVVVPTAFSPNGDGLNDEFRVLGGPFTTYELRVFNEWGQQIFISDDQSKGWDGTFKGMAQPTGSFVFVFNGTTYSNEEVKLQGEIAIIR